MTSGHIGLYIKLPKNGSTSMKSIIWNNDVDIIYYSRPKEEELEMRAQCARNRLHSFSSLYKFTIVRNPYSRLVSAYNYSFTYCDHKLSFEQFVKNLRDKKITHPKIIRQTYPQKPQISDENSELLVNKILHLENINEEFKHIQDLFNFNVEFPFINKSTNNDYHSYYNREIFDIVTSIYNEDIKTFGYETTWENFMDT